MSYRLEEFIPESILNLKRKWNIMDDFELLQFETDNDNRVIELHLEDHEYYDFPIIENDLSFLSEFPHLEALYVELDQPLRCETLPDLPELKILEIDLNEHCVECSTFGRFRKLTSLQIWSQVSSQTASFLYELTALQRLQLSVTGTHDIRVLNEMPRLSNIVLSGGKWMHSDQLIGSSIWNSAVFTNCQLDDYRFLESCTGLAFLSLTGGNLLDADFVRVMPNLGNLVLTQMNLEDISAITHCKQLTYLSLTDNKIHDISPIKDLSQLKNLILTKNRITDLEPLSKLYDLTLLHVSNNSIESILPLARLHQLKYCFAENNLITEIDCLSGLQQLFQLHVNGNRIEVIQNIPDNLVLLSANNNPIRKAHFQNKHKLSSLGLREHQIATIDDLEIVDCPLTFLDLTSASENPLLNRRYEQKMPNEEHIRISAFFESAGDYYFSKKEFNKAMVCFDRVEASDKFGFIFSKKISRMLIEAADIVDERERHNKLLAAVQYFRLKKKDRHYLSESVFYPQVRAEIISSIEALSTVEEEKSQLLTFLNPPPVSEKQNESLLFAGSIFEKLYMGVLVAIVIFSSIMAFYYFVVLVRSCN